MTRTVLQMRALVALAAASGVWAVEYAIVGAGPAGYVIAERLSRDVNVSVVLLEAGPDASSDPTVQVPAKYFFDQTYIWNYDTQPDPNISNLTTNLWQGRALGGGTTVNAQYYCRGSASVFDEWAQISGNDGLAWDALLQDFRATTVYQDQPTNYTQVVNSSVFGDGPLAVSRARTLYDFDKPLASAFESMLDLPEIDFVDGSGIGHTYGLATIINTNRTRSFAENSYGSLFVNRPNVQVLANAWVSRVGFSGTTARSVEYTDTTTNETYQLSAKEIIITAGAINAAHLLMLSGVGPKSDLEALNISVVADIPEVGDNLIDHHYSVVQYRAAPEVETLWQWSDNSTGTEIAIEEYNDDGNGPLGENNCGVMASQRLSDSIFESVNSSYYLNIPTDRPQIGYLSATTPFLFNSPNESIVSAFAAVVQPEAKGVVKLNTDDYRDAPLIFANIYGSVGDKAAIMAGYKNLRAVLESESLRPYLVEEIYPGTNVTSDDEIWQAIEQSAGTWHHPVGTTALGTVLDCNWRVKGLKGLRVVGASALPTIPTCPIQGAVYAIANVAARNIYDTDINT